MDSGALLLCQFCGQGTEVDHIAGIMHAEPSSSSGKLICAHHRCMEYASGLTQCRCLVFDGFDIADVEKEIARGQKLLCSLCKGSKGRKARGASCGCPVKYCRKNFHYPCATVDPTAVTKKLVVSTTHPPERYTLYRVFCSSAHEEIFRKTLREELRALCRKKRRSQIKKTASSHELEVGGKDQNCSESAMQGEITAASFNQTLMSTEDGNAIAAGVQDSEGSMPEGSQPEGTMPEGTMPEGTMPEGTMPGGSRPLTCPLTEEQPST